MFLDKDSIVPDPSVSAVIRLNYPVNLADRQVHEVTMRRPALGVLLDHEPKRADDVAAEVKLVGMLCGMKMEEMRALDSTDYARLQEQYLRFRAVPKQEADTGVGDGPLPPDPVGN